MHRMWNPHYEQIDLQTIRITFHQSGRDLSFREVIRLWKESEAFGECFTSALAGSSFEAFFWETPPVTHQTSNRSFECVLVEGKSLTWLTPDFAPFQSQCASHNCEQILTFPNLGGDAILIVPVPIAAPESYTHLAQFLRKAPSRQVLTLWKSVSCAMQDRMSNAPTWLSVAGMGVSWLHLRLDSRPKYYRYSPYRLFA